MQFKRYRIFFLVAIIPLVFTFRSPEFSKQLQVTALSVMKPFLATGHEFKKMITGTADGFRRFRESFRSVDENAKKVVELEARLSQLQEVSRENERLRGLLNFSSSFPQKAIAAEILGWDNSQWRHAAVLNKGIRHGLKKDMTVVVAEGLVGRIFQISEHSSRLILLSDPDSRVSAISAESREQGVISGDGSFTLKLRYLDLDSTIAVGEEVLTSVRGGLFPKGIRIGKITSIHKDRDGLHLEADVTPYVHFKKLEEVLCLADK